MTVERREGGTREARTLPTREPHREQLDTRRYDAGGSLQAVIDGRFVVTARAASAWQRHDHAFGPVRERDAHDSTFAEIAVRGASGRQTWVAGLAYERDHYVPRDVPQSGYTFHAPGVFAQSDVDVNPWLAVSAGARLDWHDEYGTFLSPHLAALVRAGGWRGRVSAGRGYFAATPLTEETEAAGLTGLVVRDPLRAEQGSSLSADVTRDLGPASLTVTTFASRVTGAVGVEREEAYALFVRDSASTNTGVEVLATARSGDWVATGNYAYVRSREWSRTGRDETPLTPRHSAGFVGMWESEDTGRVGVEVYYTGRQGLEANPFRDESRPYVIVGLLVERVVGRMRLFVNGENLTNVRQTRWDPLLRRQPGADRRWTVDAWAPLDGRAVNGGIRLMF